MTIATQAITPIRALLIGMALLLLACVFAEVMFGNRGHRIDFDKLPPEVRSIAMENHPNPISSEQWQRMDQAMARHEGWPTSLELAVASIRKVLPLFLLLPALALIGFLVCKQRFSLLSVALLFMPCVSCALFAVLFQGEGLARIPASQQETEIAMLKRSTNGAWPNSTVKLTPKATLLVPFTLRVPAQLT
jgi:hypothetical protein